MKRLNAGSVEDGKAECTSKEMTWSKVKPIHLGPHTTAQEELTAAVNNFLNDYGSRKACMLGRFHAERVRQMRVAVRRPRVLPVSI